MSQRRKAKRSSLRALSAKLGAAGHPVSRSTVAKLLRKMDYSPKANARRAEARSVPPQQRSAQFDHITAQRAQFAAAGDPVSTVHRSAGNARPASSRYELTDKIANGTSKILEKISPGRKPPRAKQSTWSNFQPESCTTRARPRIFSWYSRQLTHKSLSVEMFIALSRSPAFQANG